MTERQTDRVIEYGMGGGYAYMLTYTYTHTNTNIKHKHKHTHQHTHTHRYMSPEVVLTQGHDKSADYWALGTLVYEMLVGGTPFESVNQKRTFEKVCICVYMCVCIYLRTLFFTHCALTVI